MPVRELLARTDSRELAEWMAFEKIDGPLGGARGDHQAAVIAATVANTQRDSRTPPIAVATFLPEWDPRPPQTWQEQYDIVRAMNAAFGGSEG